EIIADQLEGAGRISGSQDGLFHRRGDVFQQHSFHGFAGYAPTFQQFRIVLQSSLYKTIPVFQQIGVARTGRDSSELVRIGGAEIPGSVAAHGVTGQVNFLRIRLVNVFGFLQDFHRIDPPPVFPRKSKRSPVGGGDQGPPVLFIVGIGLVDSFYRSAVDREKKSLAVPWGIRAGCYAVILEAAVHGAEEGAFVVIVVRPDRNGRRKGGYDPSAVVQRFQDQFLF